MKTTIRSIYNDTDKYLNQEIQLSGWIRTSRSSKTFGFIELNDGTFFKNIQIVFEEGLENFKEIEKLALSSSIIVRGTLVPTPEAKQPFEVKAGEIEVEGYSTADYPLQKKRHTFEYMRTIAHLRPRSNTFNAVFRVRSVLAYAIHKFFQDRGFVYVHTPIITASDAEGAGEMFRVSTLDFDNVPLTENKEIDYSKDFFGTEVGLTVTGQLEGEAFAHAYRDIYTFGPTFRAENSNTARHAAEFWMIEPEIAFADLVDNMQLAEDMMKYIINYVMENAKEEMEFFNNFVDKGLIERLENVVNSEFGRVTYTEAIELLKKSGEEFQFPVEWGMDLQTEHERYISEKIFKKPVFVTDYPKEIKAFYMRMNEDNKTVAAMDLLAPGVGEIIGGSQREERLDVLEQKIIDMGLDKEDYWWYLELRKFGGTKHAGYGLGFERAVMYITGMTNIRDVIPFPRTVGSAEF
ncbi:asparagine--tRNA ligase [Tissierella sp.]|uniref:asparagine--tRNA ligase n=1 Tax=Tissierella sp. TaxID=41274 RepID=UPI002857F448|nr:asparagine--tRNA ligase [Tissierella sp.]MDR7857212.1 asparagine--tRNA ligase [Tissierella sp.]